MVTNDSDYELRRRWAAEVAVLKDAAVGGPGMMISTTKIQDCDRVALKL